jgi:hypothetical protein
MAVLRFIVRAALLLAASAIGAGADRSAAPPSTLVNTQAIYAAFTINLAHFITWPEGSFPAKDSPLIIGTFPRDPINEDLDESAQGEVVDGHPIKTMRIESLDDLAKCHVLFLSKNLANRNAVLARVVRRPILTVSDIDGFLEIGGHVRFVARGSRTDLAASPENLKASGLQARAQLLRLANTQ